MKTRRQFFAAVGSLYAAVRGWASPTPAPIPPIHPAQARFMASPAPEVFYSGGFGGGSTDTRLMQALLRFNAADASTKLGNITGYTETPDGIEFTAKLNRPVEEVFPNWNADSLNAISREWGGPVWRVSVGEEDQ